MKIERLIAIIMLLLERDVVPTSELAEKLEVSRRTIFRDIDALNIAGMPIMITRGSAGGVSLMKSYKVDKKLFTPKDVQSIITSLQSYHQLLENKEIANTLTKLQSMTEADDLLKQNMTHQNILVDLELNQGNRSLRSLLKVIETAINDKRCLLFEYMNISGEASSRKVEPYKIVFKESKWYLQAFSMERNDYRVFKLARMSNVHLSDENFTPRSFLPLPMDGSDWMAKEIVEVIIEMDLSYKDRVIDRYGEDYIIACKENSFIAKYPIVDHEEGYNALLKFGLKCEILEPLYIRQNFKKYLTKIMEKYEERR